MKSQLFSVVSIWFQPRLFRDLPNSDLALGSKRFIVDMKRLTVRRAKALKRGPRATLEMAGELLL